MFSIRAGRTVLQFRQACLGRRFIFVMSREKKQRAKQKKENIQRWVERAAKKTRQEQMESKKKLKEIRSLTENMTSYVKMKQGTIGESAEKHETSDYTTTDTKSCTRDTTGFDPRNSSLLTPAMELPASINERLGPAVKYLVTKEHQNWRMALQQIEKSNGFIDLPEVDIRKMVYSIPKNQLIILFPQIERLLKEANIQKSPKIVNAFLKSLTSGSDISDERMALLELQVQELRKKNKKGTLSRETLEILVQAYGKRNEIKKMEMVIYEMRDNNLQPSFNVYSNVLSTYVYKTKDHRQAVQLFDSMKFLAGSMAPHTKEYQDIIVSYVNNGEIEKALDLYDEMTSNNIEVNQSIFVALARGCASRKQLKLQAWDFIFEIYKRDWEPTVLTMEYMLYLAAKDTDLSFARALYSQLNMSNATSPRSFGFLMKAYSNSALAQSPDNYVVPAISMHDLGKSFRLKVLDSANFSPILDNPHQSVPFLPVTSLTSSKEILSESSAIMAHALLASKTFVNTESVNNFLNVAAKLGTLNEFIDRFKQFTFLDVAGIPETTNVLNTKKTEEIGIKSSFSSKSQHLQATKSPILTEISSELLNLRIPRNSITYIIALQAAARHKNYDFSRAIWEERGRYRKSNSFKLLSQVERRSSDFSFAAAMVNCLAEMNLLEDALAILVSTEYQFRWTWKELRQLYNAAVEIGNQTITKTVRGIVGRAQIRFEGKIKRSDYRKYVLERGY